MYDMLRRSFVCEAFNKKKTHAVFRVSCLVSGNTVVVHEQNAAYGGIYERGLFDGAVPRTCGRRTSQ